MELETIYKEKDLLSIYQALKDKGVQANPRGDATLEIENFTYSVGPFVRFNSFEGRNFNLAYLKREMAWYIKADPFDTSIAEHAMQWGKIILNGKLNSNYGAYWFGKHGVQHIVALLQKDPMSRRAVIPMYGTDIDHMDLEAKDVPCTTCIEFRLREGILNARVVMRSQDVLWGMANDLPTFSFLHEIAAALLKVAIGTLTVSVGSFHVYMSRIQMFDAILNAGTHVPVSNPPPAIQYAEALELIDKTLNPYFEFSKWLLNR